MAILTLTEAQKHFNDPVAAGVADTLVSVDPMFEVIPAIGIAGSSLTVNQETTGGAADWYDTATTSLIDTVTTHGDPNTSTTRTFTLHPIVGHAVVTKFHQATSAAAGVDQLAMQIASKARNIGRKVRSALVNETGSTDAPDGLGLWSQVSAVTAPSTTDVFECLDALLDAVTSKDGQVDAIVVNEEVMRKIRSKVRSLSQSFEYWTSPVTGQNVLAYNGTPIFRNQNIPAEDVNDQSNIYALNFEDGGNNGLALIYPDGTNAGIEVNAFGESEIYHADTARVSQICGFALYNDDGAKKMNLDTTSM